MLDLSRHSSSQYLYCLSERHYTARPAFKTKVKGAHGKQEGPQRSCNACSIRPINRVLPDLQRTEYLANGRPELSFMRLRDRRAGGRLWRHLGRAEASDRESRSLNVGRLPSPNGAGLCLCSGFLQRIGLINHLRQQSAYTTHSSRSSIASVRRISSREITGVR